MEKRIFLKEDGLRKSSNGTPASVIADEVEKHNLQVVWITGPSGSGKDYVGRSFLKNWGVKDAKVVLIDKISSASDSKWVTDVTKFTDEVREGVESGLIVVIVGMSDNMSDCVSSLTGLEMMAYFIQPTYELYIDAMTAKSKADDIDPVNKEAFQKSRAEKASMTKKQFVDYYDSKFQIFSKWFNGKLKLLLNSPNEPVTKGWDSAISK